MRTLVTGAQGFVGLHLVAYFRNCGDEVTAIDRDVDVTKLDQIREAIGTCRPEVIIHLAAWADVGGSWTNSAECMRVNVGGTANVLAAARELAPESTTLVVSSSDVYGVVSEDNLPLHETWPPVPVSPYAQSKLEAERIALDDWRSTGQRIVIARPFNHLGPGQSTSFVAPALASRLIEARSSGQKEIAVGDLTTRRDFCDVRDVVRAYRLLAEYGRAGQTYHVASGQDVALSDVAKQLVELIAPQMMLRLDQALVRPVEVPVLRGSFAKLHDETGWEPSLPLALSLADVAADAEQRFRNGHENPSEHRK